MSRGTLKRTVPNKRTSDSDEPIPRKTPRAIQEKSKAVYKTALNGRFQLLKLCYHFLDVLESRKKSRGDLEVRKRASRNKLKEMQDSSDSDAPVPTPKRKKPSKKKPRGTVKFTPRA